MSSYYEKILATGEVKCIDDEIPFDIPSSWEWVRLGAIFHHTSGKQQSSSNKSVGNPQKFITTSNLYWGRFVLDNVKVMNFTDEEIHTSSATKGDLLVCEGGAGYGRSAIWNFDYDICLQNHVHRLRPIVNGTCEYVYHFIYYLKETNQLAAVGTAMPGLSANRLKGLLLPFPPLSEQARIVSRLSELENPIDKYDDIYSSLTSLNDNIKGKLNKSILQEAIQGRLVPQIESEGTADELLEEIRAEKKRLVKEGKLKASTLKEESRIFKGEDNKYFKKSTNKAEDITDKIPFDIPKNWRWCRLETIIYNVGTKMNQIQSKEVLSEGCIPVVSQSNKLIDGYCNEQNKAITDLPLIMFGDHTRQVKFIDFPFIIGADGTKFHKCVLINPRYLYYWMTIVAEQLRNRGYARHYSLLKQVLVPLPPLKEQHRIVNKLDVIVTSIMSR